MDELQQIARQQFSTDEQHRQAFDDLIAHLRSEALSNGVDGINIGCPTVLDFLDQLVGMRDTAAAGTDLIHNVVWRHSPHWFKARLYALLRERFFAIHWENQHLQDWQHFELRGVPKTKAPESFGDHQWLGILSHLCKVFGATYFCSMSTSLRMPSRSCSYGYKRGTSVEDCFAILFEALAYATTSKDAPLIIQSLRAFRRP